MSSPSLQKRLPSTRAGFSMIEVMVVVIVIALLALMAVPSLLSIVPYAQVRLEAKNAATIMRQARLRAASTQRPTRVVLSCRAHYADHHAPCVFTMQSARYDQGTLEGWSAVPIGGMQGAHELNPGIRARSADESKDDDSIFWIIFMPSSRIYSSHEPYEIQFVPERFQDSDRGVWQLSVNNSTGRTTLVRLKDG